MGAGPIGLRTALELALQGAQVPGEKLEGPVEKISSLKSASTSFQLISWAFDGCNIVYIRRIIYAHIIKWIRWGKEFGESFLLKWPTQFWWFCLEEGSGSSIDSWRVGSKIGLKLLQVRPRQVSQSLSSSIMLSQTVLVGLSVMLATGEWVGNDCSKTWWGDKHCEVCRPDDDDDPDHPKPDRRQCSCQACRGLLPAGINLNLGPVSISGNGDCNYVCQCHACQPGASDASILLTLKHKGKDIAIPFHVVAGFALFVTIAVVTAFIAKRMAIPSLAQPLLAEDADSADSAAVAVI